MNNRVSADVKPLSGPIYDRYIRIIESFDSLKDDMDKWTLIYEGGYEQLLKHNINILNLERYNEHSSWSPIRMVSAYHIQLIELVLSTLTLTPRDFDVLFTTAAGFGRVKIAKIVYNKWTEIMKRDHLAYRLDINYSLTSAAGEGHLEMVKYLVELGANDFNEAAKSATGHDNMMARLEAINFLLERGANDLNGIMRAAAENNASDIVEKMLRLGATNVNEGLIGASYGGNIELVKKFLDLGATSYDEALDNINMICQRDRGWGDNGCIENLILSYKNKH